MEIIKNNHPEIHFARDVTGLLGVTTATLSREFHRQLGVCITQLIRFYKIRHAVALMENPGLNLNEIADLTGFANRTTFYRCFQQLTGRSPREFRKMEQSVDFERIFREKIIKK